MECAMFFLSLFKIRLVDSLKSSLNSVCKRYLSLLGIHLCNSIGLLNTYYVKGVKLAFQFLQGTMLGAFKNISSFNLHENFVREA